MHLFYEIILNRTLPTNPTTEGADAGWGLALASKEKTARVEFIMTVFYQVKDICQEKAKTCSAIIFNAHLLGYRQMLKEKCHAQNTGAALNPKKRKLENNQLVGLPLQEGIHKRHPKCIWSSQNLLSEIGRAFLSMLSKDFPVLAQKNILTKNTLSSLP